MTGHEWADKEKKKLEQHVNKLKKKNEKLQDKYVDTKEKLERRMEAAARNQTRWKGAGIFFLVLVLLGAALNGGYYLAREKEYQEYQGQVHQREYSYQKILDGLED